MQLCPIQLLELCIVQPVREQRYIHAVVAPIRLPATNAMHTTVTGWSRSQDPSVSMYVLSQFHVVSPFIVVVPLMTYSLLEPGFEPSASACSATRGAIQLCIQHSTGTNTMLRDLDQPTH